MRAKQRCTEGAGEMLDVVLLVAGRNIATTKGRAAIGTDEVQTAKVVSLTKWQLFPFGAVDGKKL